MLPPEDVTPSELWTKLNETPAPSEVVDFPRRGADGNWIGKLRIFVLDGDQIDRCRIRGQEVFRKMPRVEKGDEGSLVGQEVVADLIARECLAEACWEERPYNDDPSNPKYRKIFITSQHLGKLSRDETTALWASYIMVQDKFGPHDSNLSVEEVNAWIKRLVEGGSAHPLAQLGSAQLVALTQWLAVRVYILSAGLSRHSSSLPSSLASLLAEWGCGTSSSGEPPSDSAVAGTSELVTIEEAIEAARKLTQKLNA